MLITEWSIEDEKAVSFEEGREEGWFELAELLREGKTLDEAMVWLKDQNSSDISAGI